MSDFEPQNNISLSTLKNILNDSNLPPNDRQLLESLAAELDPKGKPDCVHAINYNGNLGPYAGVRADAPSITNKSQDSQVILHAACELSLARVDSHVTDGVIRGDMLYLTPDVLLQAAIGARQIHPVDVSCRGLGDPQCPLTASTIAEQSPEISTHPNAPDESGIPNPPTV